MKNHRFLWLRNRTTDNRKCEKARNIKEKRTIEMFNTVSRPHAARRSSASAEFPFASFKGSSSCSTVLKEIIRPNNFKKTAEIQRFCGFFNTQKFCCHVSLHVVKTEYKYLT